jgi:anti-sigma factor RsiW
MCDERERLIGYLYEECDAEERRQVETHLESCPTCRAEIGGLQSVRTDLLAWNVPEHAPVWRPMPAAAAPPVVWWRQTPGWALAAAATVVLAAGIAGGAATRMMTPAPAQAQVAGVTTDELTAMQQQIVTMLRAELDRVRAEASAPGQPRAELVSSGQAAEVERRVLERIAQSDQRTLDQLNGFFRDVVSWNKNSDQNIRKIKQEIEDIKASLLNPGGGR